MDNRSFDIIGRLPYSFKTITEYAEDVIDILVDIASVEPCVLTPVFATGRFSRRIDLDRCKYNEAVESVVDCTLRKYKGEIKRHSGIKNPPPQTKQSIGFRIMFQVKEGSKTVFVINFLLGGRHPGFQIEWFDDSFKRNYQWRLDIVRAVLSGNNSYSPTYVTVRPLSNIGRELVIGRTDVTATLGWATFFSKELLNLAALELPHYHRELVNDGELLTLPQDADDSVQDAHAKYVSKMSEAMSFLFENIPSYRFYMDKYNEETYRFRHKYPLYTMPGYNLNHQGKLIK